MLIVRDNGIGLDRTRMGKLLATGQSHHEDSEKSTGSYGVGHTTTVALSGLQYVLYAGLNKKQGAIASGKAQLAAHSMDSKRRSGFGYFVVDAREDFQDPADRFIYGSTEDEHNVILSKEFARLKQQEQGTSIIIPALDLFIQETEGEAKQKEIAKIILKAVARSFFISILKGQLSVSILFEGQPHQDLELTPQRIHDLLSQDASESRIKGRCQVAHESGELIKPSSLPPTRFPLSPSNVKNKQKRKSISISVDRGRSTDRRFHYSAMECG